MPTPILLDTDIASNVDDLLALLLVAGSPELELVGVTTVYGDTELRARVARKVLDLLGLHQVPVAAGARTPRSNAPIFWAGHEGTNYGDLGAKIYPPHEAAALFATLLESHGEDLVIAGIGPFTNAAAFAEHAKSAGARTPRLVLMGGQFGDGPPDRNVRSDAVAAADMLAALSAPATLVGIELCRQVWLADEDLTRMVHAGPGELSGILRAEMETWWKFKEERRSNPCDPLTLMALLRPDLFTFAEAHVRFDTGEREPPGTTIIETGPARDGGLSYATSVDIPQVRAEIVRRITRALALR